MSRVTMLVSAAALIAAGANLGEPAMANQNDPRLDALLARLQAAAEPHTAVRVEQEIWRIWNEAHDAQVDRWMAHAARAMQIGDFEAARAALDSVTQADPGFSEGWNRRATLYYMMRDFDASVADIDRTLALEPRHFGALSGLALIREAQGRPFEALEALESVLKIHPQLPNLADWIDRLTRQLGEAI